MQSVQELHWIIFVGGYVLCGTHLLSLQIHTGRIGSKIAERTGGWLFPGRCSLGLC
jgi:hypothetical protein